MILRPVMAGVGSPVIQACAAHNIEKQLAPLPCSNNPEQQSHERRLWVLRIARVVNAELINQYAFFNAEMARCHVDGKEKKSLEVLYEWALKNTAYPLDAPEQTFRCVHNFETYWGGIPAPTWCNRGGEKYRRLWLALVLYGANGAEFPFASGRMATACKIPSRNTVNRFLKLAVKNGLLVIVKTGLPNDKGGTPAYYRLATQKDYSVWRLIAPSNPLPPNGYNHIPFGEYAANNLSWLGKKALPVLQGKSD